MKNTNYFLGLFFLSFFVFFSCDKDEVEEPELLDCTQGELTFKLNDTPWTATSFTNTLIFATDPQSGISARRCDIRAANEEGEQLVIAFTNPYATDDTCMDSGSYTGLSDVTSIEDNSFIVTLLDSQGGIFFLVTDGNLFISECTIANSQRNITGTFAFEDVIGNYTVTEGQFSICIP